MNVIVNMNDIDECASPEIHDVIAKASMQLMEGPVLREVPIPFQSIFLSPDRWRAFNMADGILYFGSCSSNPYDVVDAYTVDFHAHSGAHLSFHELTNAAADKDADYADLFLLFSRALFGGELPRRAAFEVTVLFRQYGQIWVLDHN